jgi:anti-sigma regulatory factor (Ser/Thr protein kinase)
MTGRIIAGASPVRLDVREQSHVGECRRSAKLLAETCGFDEEGVGKICIVATELATNVVRHGGGGEMLQQVLDDGAALQLEIIAIDAGRGMRNVEECLRDGYSTGGTPGTGLGAVSRLSTAFDIYSAPDRGAIVMSRIARRADPLEGPAPASALEFGAVCRALAGEIECGDTWRIAEDGSSAAMLVVDGLGHGSFAAAAARTAAQVFAAKPFDEPAAAMQSLHRGLLGSRGAVAACAQLNISEARVDYAGVGNIYGAIVGKEGSRGMVSYNGTLGGQCSRTRQFTYPWPEGSLVVVHSDGLSARWDLADHPGLINQHAAVIAAALYRESARKGDDATVLVARRRP